jgi:hypothetical protein
LAWRQGRGRICGNVTAQGVTAVAWIFEEDSSSTREWLFRPPLQSPDLASGPSRFHSLPSLAIVTLWDVDGEGKEKGPLYQVSSFCLLVSGGTRHTDQQRELMFAKLPVMVYST